MLREERKESKIPNIIGMILGGVIGFLFVYFVYIHTIVPMTENLLNEQLGMIGLKQSDKIEGTNCYVGMGMNGLTGTCLDGSNVDNAFKIYAKTHPQAQRYLEMFK